MGIRTPPLVSVTLFEEIQKLHFFYYLWKNEKIHLSAIATCALVVYNISVGRADLLYYPFSSVI